MIEVRDVRISFGGRTVIDGIDLSVPAAPAGSGSRMCSRRGLIDIF